ncbi:T9SS type A sorting domain-containing protein [candidate division KSB1 bacterium]|nr:T9SS type A sorting domain-containing protein [candidate division KSB1 bacterium]
MMKYCILLTTISFSFAAEITVDASAGRHPISPYIYGKNNCLADQASNALSKAEWQFLRDAGVRIVRENGGNNSTKYNWRRKLTSHPDWYNNVYNHDWNYAAQSLQHNLPGVKGMWAFQLIGKAAKTSAYNFNDWGYNRSQWWEGVHNNWAGGGGPDQGEGNPDLYLENWPPDSTVGILEKWFGNGGLGLDPGQFQYWNMDNEPEVWHGTHDDVYPQPPPVEEYMQAFFDVAKKAREIFPEIKLVGPVATNEWQWYNWNDNKISSGGKNYVWLEYFIKRIGEEQQASGIRLLDVLDIHFYPGESNTRDILQLHRVWFDKTYNYPGANGVKRAGNSGWDNNIRQEYIFERCRIWLEKYIGADHAVTFCVSEMGIQGNNPNVTACWYASTLGVFADNGVEIFTPWSWKTGMWEALHLFSRYTKSIRVLSQSDNEENISAYSSLSPDADSLTVVLVNRTSSGNEKATVSLKNFEISDGDYNSFMLANLPGSETFKSHTDNALKSSLVNVADSAFEITLPSLSITAVQLKGKGAGVLPRPDRYNLAFDIYPNPFNPGTTISWQLKKKADVKLEVFDVNGRHIKTLVQQSQIAGEYRYRFSGIGLASGVYFVRLETGNQVSTRKMTLLR